MTVSALPAWPKVRDNGRPNQAHDFQRDPETTCCAVCGWCEAVHVAGVALPPTHVRKVRAAERTTGDVIWLETTTQAVLTAAANYGAAMQHAETLEHLVAVQEQLDEAIGALLAQEQVLIRTRELLQAMKGTGR